MAGTGGGNHNHTDTTVVVMGFAKKSYGRCPI
jgi:hypothetical protein